MSTLLADIDATCAALGYNSEDKYYAEPEAIHGLKHLIWVLRRDLDNHEYRRHLGHSKVLQTDLIPMLIHYINDDEYSDVLIRLLVILTNPTLLLYREGGIPKDNHGRKIYLELIDILQDYKEGFTTNAIWASLAKMLHQVLDIDWALRREEQGLLIERILVLIRNVLQIPANPANECRADNDASLHDQIIWALHQSGILDLVLYVLSSSDENQYHLHALEILCLLYREQTADTLANASLNRSTLEKQRDEQELISARAREKQKFVNHPPAGRHSRFGGTYILQNCKSVSDNDIICHQPLERAAALDFDREKSKQKRSFRLVTEDNSTARRSAFSIRLCLREFCIELLRSAYNNLVRQVRRVLERSTGGQNCDDSYLLWAIKFFMEFNRLSGLELNLVSESISVQSFHWVLTRIQHNMDMLTCDKKQARLWARRLHVAIQTFRELLLSLLPLQKMPDEKPRALFDMLINNICYTLEYRETVIHLLMNFNEVHSTKAYLRDVVETANIFIKIMEKFCKDSVVVQDKKRNKIKKKSKKNDNIKTAKKNNPEISPEELENKWSVSSLEIINFLENGNITLPEQDHPLPFDAALEKPIEDQKEDCMMQIYKFLHEEKFEHAVILLRAGREVWPENDCFGSYTAAPEDELLILGEIYLSNLGPVEKPSTNEPDDDVISEEDDEYDDEEEYDEKNLVEKDFRFEDLTKRLLNPKVVRACTIVLSDWDKILTKSLKAAVTLLHRIAVGCSCPAMLFQATLFRIFQQVFDAPPDSHQEELRRLGIYVIRKFTELSKKNPKIFAELLFYKTIKEANELEFGYCDAYDVKSKNGWSEEQENELRMLFEENQSNPENDKDVIDWILDNLIDKTRTRRGVMKKMKEMELIFKAPTKKSSAANSNKNLWSYDEDERLKNLYDEHRLDADCLKKIIGDLGDKRSKNIIVKRMIQLHLIADEFEILPKKKSGKSKKKNAEFNDGNLSESELIDGNISESESNSFNRNMTANKIKKTAKTKKLNQHKNININSIKTLISEIDEKFKEALDWLKESLADAIEDMEDVELDDEDDGVPLVPLLDIQKEAVDNLEFKNALNELGFQSPIDEVATYWRIPFNFTIEDLKLRLKILNNDEIDEKELKTTNYEHNDSDSDVSVDYLENLLHQRKQNFDDLVFNESDTEDTFRNPIRKASTSNAVFDNVKPDKKSNKKKEKMKASSTEENLNEDMSNIRKTKKSKSKININDMLITNTDDIDLDINSESLRLRLAELSDSENSDSNTASKILQNTNSKKKMKRLRISSGSESSDHDDKLSSFKNQNDEINSNISNLLEENLDIKNTNGDVVLTTTNADENSDKENSSLTENLDNIDGEDSDEDDIFNKKRKVKNDTFTGNHKKRRLVISDDDSNM